MYPEPDEFRPERFMCSDTMKPAPLDPRAFSFGIGRRICPGRYFAETVLYSLVTTMLATCVISKPVDDEGKEYEPHVKFSGNALREMEPFTVRTQPRSDNAIALLRSMSVNP